MVKINGPLMSFEASGQLAKTIIFQKNRMSRIVRPWKKKNPPGTLKAVVQRSEYGNAAADWRTAIPEIKRIFRKEAQNQKLTGYNLFLRDWFVKRYSCRYGLARYGISVLGMDREFQKYPERLEVIK